MTAEVRGILVAMRGAIDGANALLFMAMRRTSTEHRGALQGVQAGLLEARRQLEAAINPPEKVRHAS